MSLTACKNLCPKERDVRTPAMIHIHKCTSHCHILIDYSIWVILVWPIIKTLENCEDELAGLENA